MRSMTGFGAAEGAVEGASGASSWRWEARSVNGRGLDIRLRTPNGWEGEEPKWRAAAQALFRRGSVSLSLQIEDRAEARPLRLNEDALSRVIAAALVVEAKAQEAGLSTVSPSIDGLLGLRGVLETDQSAERSDADRAALSEALRAGLDAALAGLVAARAGEGAKLFETLSGHLDTIAALTEDAAAQAAAREPAMKERLRQRVAATLEAAAGAPEMDDARLSQELALLAVKADVQEEIDRLRTHIASARALIASTEPIGRKLDFLAQEFNREANTLASKAQDAALTETALGLKVVIDQLKEQAANVE